MCQLSFLFDFGKNFDVKVIKDIKKFEFLRQVLKISLDIL